MSAWFKHSLRVRYGETDRMAVVYHTNYINWFEIGRTEWIRHTGLAYRAIEERGLLLPVVNLECSYIQPARYDDVVTVFTRVTEFTKVRIRFEYQVLLGDYTDGGAEAECAEVPEGKVLARGASLHGWINNNWKVVALDRTAPEIYELIKRTIGGEAK
ncbi:thioesterase family protein [Cohnella lubricantis]|uniref:Acyl-CoA thioesterase n=1 Tax=Cohnella lubricantis TaxID=2163172 RepID=A0A841T9U5_9BACL|nr:thioesterase family protein [Cohnella lubricantis]MBB6676030.1 acyl-CoA thioesterase [Cohnella lubricantis]MBP2117957.1 acyl-CoA thioester hydrolase [Cohnella lubricantis]